MKYCKILLKLNIIVFYGGKKPNQPCLQLPSSLFVRLFLCQVLSVLLFTFFSHLFLKVHFQYKKRKPVLTNWVGGRTSGASRSPSCFKTKMKKKKKEIKQLCNLNKKSKSLYGSISRSHLKPVHLEKVDLIQVRICAVQLISKCEFAAGKKTNLLYL